MVSESDLVGLPCSLTNLVTISPLQRNSTSAFPMDFGEAKFVLTSKLKSQLLVCPCEDDPDRSHLFYKNSSKRLACGTVSTYFICKSCSDVAVSGSARVTVRNGLVVSDPSLGHHPDCIPFLNSEIEALQLIREAKGTCRNGQRPMQAYQEALSKIPARFLDQATQENVELAVGSYSQHRSSFYR